jgi:integrase
MKITVPLIDSTIEKCSAHMRTRGLSKKTRDAYLASIRRFMLWEMHNWNTIEKLDSTQRMGAFLSSLANDKKRPISFSTQNSYFMAILYFYREFKGETIGKINAARAPIQQRIFNVPTREQLIALFDAMPELPLNFKLLAQLMFGTGMRLDEVISLRVKDVLFNEKLIAVQEGKGDKSRLVDMPAVLVDPLHDQLIYARSQYDADRALKRPGIHLPNSLALKYPAYATAWEWYWVFPHFQEGWDPDEQIKRRYHVYDFDVQRTFRDTRRKLNLPEYTTAHSMRHAYATFYLSNLLSKIKASKVEIPNLYDFCRDSLRKKLGHVSQKTTDLYIHLATERDDISDASPLDLL